MALKESERLGDFSVGSVIATGMRVTVGDKEGLAVYVDSEPRPQSGRRMVLVAHDETSSRWHDGNGGCENRGIPKLPQYAHRCYWYFEGEVTPASYDLVDKVESEATLDG